MNPSVPVSLNLTRRTKSPNDRVVVRNSLRGTCVDSEPPTMAPSWMRQVDLVSPSQPVNVRPSNSGTGFCGVCREPSVSDANARTDDSRSFICGAYQLPTSNSHARPPEQRGEKERHQLGWRCFTAVFE